LLVLTCIAVAAAVAVGSVIAAMAARDAKPAERAVPSQTVAGPVLLVPGYGGETGALEQLASRLRAAGRTATVVQLPDGGVGDLNGQATALDRSVTEALRDGAPSVDVVGYSAGGIVARLWVQQHDGADKARRIITLGSPHHGTTLAAAGAAALPGACPTACQQLVPGSRLLSGLTTPVPNPPAWLSVWTEQDQTVTPPSSAQLDGALSFPVQSICPDIRLAHSQLPTNPVVQRIAEQALGAQPLAWPTAAVC
jgi:pimeloyl-ACP methyl ester carboxylesterase